MPVIDVHHHIGPRDRIAGPVSAFELTTAVDRHLAILDRYGIDACCLIPSHNARMRTLDDVRRLNDYVAAARDRAPDRFVAAIGTVDPSFTEEAREEIERCARDLGFRAMAWHPRFQGVATDSPSMVDLVRHTVELGLPVFMHMLAESTHEAPWRLAKVAEMFPEGQFVALDAFTSHGQSLWVAQFGGALTNVSFELALIMSSSTAIVAFAERWGADRLLFGSDYYEGMQRRFPVGLHEVRDSDLPPEVQERILGGNAERLLGFSSARP